MRNEPKCPWCGREMIAAYNPPEDHTYRCLYCRTNSPIRHTPSEAWKAAISRPPQKPLTLEETWKKSTTLFDNVVWIEFKDESEDYSDVIPALISNHAPWPPNKKHLPDKYYFRYLTWPKDVIEVEKVKYGQKHRCWASRPTDEERAAAPWEGTGDADL